MNVFALEGMGKLGADQLNWLAADLKARSSSTPIVVFAHIPLWAVFPAWGWGTEDSVQALTYLKRFASAMSTGPFRSRRPEPPSRPVP